MNTTACGLPIDTAVRLTCQPSTSTGRAMNGPASAPAASCIGIRAGISSGSPISTTAPSTSPFSAKRKRTSLIPASVSMRTVSRAQMPASCTYLPTQRTALPHISDSEPSALNMRMRASAPATVDGRISTSPSEPTPKCRSLMPRANAPGSLTCSSNPLT